MSDVSASPGPLAVIMSVYAKDDPKLFHRALRSIEEQDYKASPIRIYLCVDGQVGADIEDVLKAHKAAIYKVLRNPTNIGLAGSLNRLIDSLEDEAFVFRMDSDDYSRPYRIREQIEALQENPDIDILGGAITEVDPEGRVLRSFSYPKEQEEILDYITRRCPLAHPTVCFRRSAIGVFGHYPDVSPAEDIALWFKCLDLGLTISNIDSVLVEFSVSKDFYRRRGPKKAFKELKVKLSGVWRLRGLTWRLIFPLLLFALRLSPQFIVERIYNSRLR